ncbi:subtilisin [Actimicrobium sp. GrIS 1.19]|uniref:S8 family peptidase n=1 Tax=Actimicrobium sp. GrIS 1.19 TaxID=3071708 RepID=UPI002E0B9625|nr:subtilisin [Actimicrobium sp. GrIS 1.19]
MAKNPESPNPSLSESPGPSSSSARSNGAPASAADPRSARSAAAPGGGQALSPGASSKHTLSARKGQFLISPRRVPGMQAMGLQPLALNVIEDTLRSSPDIEVIDTVGPKNIIGVLADGMSESPGVLVARMTDQKATVLHQQAQGRLIVERDHPLTLGDSMPLQPMMVSWSAPTSGQSLDISVTVLGRDDAPVADAAVYLFGSMIPATGTTDARGQVNLSLFGETPQTIRGLYVKPKTDYWSFYQTDPDIRTDEPNVVGLRPLADWPALANFPQNQVYGWGQKAMRLDQLPNQYRGQGVRIAIIDSGAATSHEDLKKIRFGFDVINKKTNPDGWSDDTVSHGSHCAGIICGSDNAFGVRGFAPDAEVHACKLFPGGQFSQLIDALEYCIEKQIDVVNLSLGGAAPSEALEQQILRAKRAGIACIVAAGNSSGEVQYPASSPNVLAVAAIGRLGEFPQDSYHAQTLTQMVDANGFFSPKFTCFGPQIAVCAPGVAITSSVPGNNFAAWDGTSMATPHVTGLAALTLAHHPDFQNAFKARGPERVDRLFQIIKASSHPINLGDPSRTGFGLPDVLIAVGLQAPMGMPSGLIQRAFSGAAQPQMMSAQPGQSMMGMQTMSAGFAGPYGGFLPPYLGNLQQGLPYGYGFGRPGW